MKPEKYDNIIKLQSQFLSGGRWEMSVTNDVHLDYFSFNVVQMCFFSPQILCLVPFL